MSEGIMLTIDDNGVAHEYNGKYDIVIHCESEREQTKIMEWLKSQKIEGEE